MTRSASQLQEVAAEHKPSVRLQQGLAAVHRAKGLCRAPLLARGGWFVAKDAG